MISDLLGQAEATGRDPAAIDIQFSTRLPGPGHDRFDAGRHLDELGAMDAIGVTWNNVGVPGMSLKGALAAMEQYGTEVITHYRWQPPTPV